MNDRSRLTSVCITFYKLNENKIKQIITDKGFFQYCIYQTEICPKTEKQHIQFYGELSKQVSIKQIKKYFADDTIHIEKRKGSQKQAITYCSKLETRKEGCKPIEIGKKKEQGERTDLSKVKEMVKTGMKTTDILDKIENLNYQTIKGTILLQGLYSKKRTTKPIVIWIYGTTGIGKTRYVFDNFTDIYTKNETKWYDGYEQNNTLLLDDYRCDFMKFHSLLRLLDRYTYQVEIKGGSIHINSKYIILTSPKSPLEMWKHRTNEDINQLSRRIDFIINMNLMEEIRKFTRK